MWFTVKLKNNFRELQLRFTVRNEHKGITSESHRYGSLSGTKTMEQLQSVTEMVHCMRTNPEIQAKLIWFP